MILAWSPNPVYPLLLEPIRTRLTPMLLEGQRDQKQAMTTWASAGHLHFLRSLATSLRPAESRFQP